MTPTYVVELTPPGRAAVAVVLVAGPEALRVVGQSFMPASGRPIDDLPFGQIVLGRWGEPDGEELIVCPRGEDQIEVHCHGGSAAIEAIIDRLVAIGCQRISWQEWVRQSCGRVSPKLDIASAAADATTCAAEIALAEATTVRAAAILLDQYHGALSRAIRAVLEAIAAADWPRAREILDGMLRWRELGLHLTKPWRVVLTGAPNVGKSSLINALAGFERAIVSPQPGTTRDVVTTTTAIAGWPVQLADTAGLRETSDELESAGVSLAEDAMTDADLVIFVRDASDVRSNISVSLPQKVRIIQVQNKIDLVTGAVQEAVASPVIATSAVTGEGLSDLLEAIGRTLVPVIPPSGTAIPFTTEQVSAIEAARDAIGGDDAGGVAARLLNALLTG
jgi:tRNA modification GTPase